MLCKLICAGVFSFPLVVSASAGVYKCFDAAEQLRSAKDQFQSARSNADDNARKYADCVEASNGHADCNVEFLRLKSDQDDLESAVSEYNSALSNFLECDHSRPAAPSRNDLGQLKALILRVILRTMDIPANKSSIKLIGTVGSSDTTAPTPFKVQDALMFKAVKPGDKVVLPPNV